MDWLHQARREEKWPHKTPKAAVDAMHAATAEGRRAFGPFSFAENDLQQFASASPVAASLSFDLVTHTRGARAFFFFFS